MAIIRDWMRKAKVRRRPPQGDAWNSPPRNRNAAPSGNGNGAHLKVRGRTIETIDEPALPFKDGET